MTYTKTTFDTVTMLPRWSPAEANKVGTELEVLDEAVFAKNYLINGSLSVWQRGTSFSWSGSNGAQYTADRWQVNPHLATSGTATQVTHPLSYVEPIYDLQINQSAANAGNVYWYVQQKVEDVRTLAGHEVTLSFDIECDTPGQLVNFLIVQRFGTGGSADVYPLDENLACPTVRTNISKTVTLPLLTGKTIGTESHLVIAPRLIVMAGSTPTFKIGNIKLTLGATVPETKRLSYYEELLGCQRYYQRISSVQGVYTSFGITSHWISTANQAIVPLSTAMRKIPTLYYSNLTHFKVFANGTNYASVTGLGIGSYDMNGTIQIQITWASGAPTCEGIFQSNNTTSAWLGFDAEL